MTTHSNSHSNSPHNNSPHNNMSTYQSLENSRIITEILKNNNLDIYQNDKEFKDSLSSYPTLSFKDDLLQLINLNATKEIHNYIHQNFEHLIDNFSWGISYQKFQVHISNMITECMKNTRVTQWLFILTNVYRLEYLSIYNSNNNTDHNLPTVDVQKDNSFTPTDTPTDHSNIDIETHSTLIDNVSISSYDLTSTENDIISAQNKQMSLVSNLSVINDQLDENENEIETIGNKKNTAYNIKKIENLKSANIVLEREIVELQKAYDIAKANFDAYDLEYKLHKNKADEYHKLIKN